jgi:uncharacterized protein (TIGR03083 family)
MSDEPPRDVLAQHRLGGPQATAVAATEYRRFADVLDALTPADWSRPTACPAWDVRRLAAHVLGATEANGSLAEMLHQLRRGRRGTTVEVDAVSGAQVRERQDLDPDELRRRFRRAVPAAVGGRVRWSRLAGAVRMRVGEPVHETWPVRYLMDVIYTRDVWMHRIDICRAIGRAPLLIREHDGRVVADVVADWAGRHRRPFDLTLDGPAGGRFVAGTAGSPVAADAVEFCRTLSGRARGQGLLATAVPF